MEALIGVISWTEPLLTMLLNAPCFLLKTLLMSSSIKAY